MKIESYDFIHPTEVEYRDLIFYLSQLVLTRKQGEIEEKWKTLNNIRHEVELNQLNLKENKRNMEQLGVTLRKMEIELMILQRMRRLRQGGMIFGENKRKIVNLINKLDQKSEEQLLEVLNKLKTIL